MFASNLLVRSAIIALTCLSLSACKNSDPIIWSTESRSPDGNWIARARTIEHSGFGTDGVETIVDIEQVHISNEREEILAFANDGAAMGLTMKWGASSHLEVTYRDDEKMLYYEVVKCCGGVEISVRNLTDVQTKDAGKRRN
jgi:hypothetical protein